jgi:hypothetical protein
MLSSATRHLRHNLVAYLALLLALSGTSYAAATKLLPANSVGTRQVINGSLLKADFKSGQLPRGPRGPAGDPGDKGDTGPAGIATVGSVSGPAGPMCADGGGACQVASSTATCPAGSVVVGGGWTSDSVTVAVPFAARTGGTTYGVIGINFDSANRSITAQAICAVGPGVQSAAASTQASSASFQKALASAKNQTAR